MLQIYNTLTNRKEKFIPNREGIVDMYVCGPTVYNLIHIGNARPLIVFDMVRRYLEFKGYQVNYVQNITDVEEKIINKAKELGIEATDLSQEYTDEFFKDLENLKIRKSSAYPKVTENMDAIICFIDQLLELDAAYQVEGNVFFRASHFAEYGKLSKQYIDDLKAGARIEVDVQKENPNDFVLWRSAKEGEVAWTSPWGMGRPGWHIECSTLVKKYLGDTIDIHGGGADLIFPHHENEIAQSETLNQKPLANYWMHNAYLTIDHEKMSKSIDNIITVRELVEERDPNLLKLAFLSVHYRTPINFSIDLMESTERNVVRIRNGWQELTELEQGELGPVNSEVEAYQHGLIQRFIEEMDDDFNSANGVTLIYELIKQTNIFINDHKVKRAEAQALKTLLENLLTVLGLEGIISTQETIDEDESWIDELVEQRNQAKADKNWAEADRLRDLLADKGILLEDTPKGVRWRRK